MKKILLLLMTCAFLRADFDATEDKDLIGGTPVEKKDFPGVVYAAFGNSRCTATVIGPRTLLTAGHCVSNGGSVSFSGIEGSKYTGRCTHAPQYSTNNTVDIALCKLDRKVSGTVYERAETKETPFQTGDQPLLCGYGCIRPGGGGGNDGILRIGRSSVTAIPNGRSNHVITTGKAANCFGDSGGPMFWTNGDSLQDRSVVSVNSLGNIQDTSYQAAVFTPVAKAFFQDWKSTNNEPICGYDSIAECRGSKPPVPVEFTIESADAKLVAVVQPNANYSVDDAKKALQAALNSLGGK